MYAKPLRNRLPAWLQLPAVLLMLMLGCDRTETQTGSAAPETSPAEPPSTQAAALDDLTSGVDLDDDPEGPRELPRTGELVGWIKSSPVRVYAADRLADAVEDADQRAILSDYRINRAAKCAYRNGAVLASVLLVEARSPDDAFGVFSTLSRADRQERRADGSVVAREKVGTAEVLTGWQGTRAVRAVFASVDDASRKAIEQLFFRVVFMMPAERPPLLLQLLPAGVETRVWLVRKSQALAGAPDPVVQSAAGAQLDALLGLSGDPVLTVASIVPPDSRERLLIWLAEFPSEHAARQAAERLELKSADDSWRRGWRVEAPAGSRLVGTWTPQAKDTEQILPALRMAMPGASAPQTPTARP